MDYPLYRYLAIVLRVVDGDTVELDIDTGFKHHWRTNCRLAKINAPEMNAGGKAAKDYLISLLPVGTAVYVISRSLDKYGRPIADIYLGGKDISQEMVKSGNAINY